MSIAYFQQNILPVKDKLFRFAHAILRNAMDAEEVVQEVFIRMWQRRDTWHQIENVEALTIKMTKNLALDKRRSKYHRTDQLPEYVEWRDTATPPDEMTACKDMIAHIRQLMQQLPEKQRLTMQLRDIEGLSYEEISTMLEMPLGQVKINLFRARTHIRQQLLKNQII